MFLLSISFRSTLPQILFVTRQTDTDSLITYTETVTAVQSFMRTGNILSLTTSARSEVLTRWPRRQRPTGMCCHVVVCLTNRKTGTWLHAYAELRGTVQKTVTFYGPVDTCASLARLQHDSCTIISQILWRHCNNYLNSFLHSYLTMLP
jgi:hypothetical protein